METISTKIEGFFSNYRFISPKLIYSSKIIYDPDKNIFSSLHHYSLGMWGESSRIETFNSREYI